MSEALPTLTLYVVLATHSGCENSPPPIQVLVWARDPEDAVKQSEILHRRFYNKVLGTVDVSSIPPVGGGS